MIGWIVVIAAYYFFGWTGVMIAIGVPAAIGALLFIAGEGDCHERPFI